MSGTESSSLTRVSRLRLALAVIGAPLLLAAFLTLLTYLVSAASEPTRAATYARVSGAAWTFFLYLPLYSLTVGLAGTLALLRVDARGRVAWALTGALLGAATAAVLGWVSAQGPVVTHVLVVAVLGLLMMSLVRGITGITPAAPAPRAQTSPVPGDDATR